MAAMQLTRTHRILIGVVVAGAVVIAGIGFAGSYAAVRALALQKGFGNFSLVFPIGIDAGICVLLALDLLLTWIRIPFPLLRQTAWLLTAATIAFNGAAAWPDPLGVGMHAVIPILFVVTVEAARHAVGRIADITADRHMEGVRITRWLLSPVPTFKLWRRMKLWELRSYEQAVGMEQDRLIYQARLQARYGRAWRRKAPVEALMPLRLARIGVPLAQTAPEGLAAAGIDPALLPPAAAPVAAPSAPALEAGAAGQAGAPGAARVPSPAPAAAVQGAQGPFEAQAAPAPQGPAAVAGPVPGHHAPPPFAVEPTAMPAAHDSAWFAAPLAPQAAYEGGYNPQYVEGLEPTPVMPPTGPEEPQEQLPGQQELPIPAARADAGDGTLDGSVDEAKFAEAAYEVFRAYIEENGKVPSPEQIDIYLSDRHGITHPLAFRTISRLMPELKQRYQRDLENEHIS
ncbi:Protein of unknown function DUF2637 [Actinobacteria bacterium OV450]|nr:Protein of unknown function DUF2637 [Actinobacteria bacterium OV450]